MAMCGLQVIYVVLDKDKQVQKVGRMCGFEVGCVGRDEACVFVCSCFHLVKKHNPMTMINRVPVDGVK